MAVLVSLVFGAACGDSAPTASTTTGSAAPANAAATAAPTGKLPDACGLIDDTAAGGAMAGTVASKSAPQPATDVSSRCEWKGSGAYTLSLLVQRGTTAKSSFDNTVSGGFVAPASTLPGADTRVRLGAPDSSGGRLVSIASYNGTYYVYFTFQGPARADNVSIETAQGLVRDALKKLAG